ncbi:MAG TPA: geranylgeranyl reductase family protein [Aliiroseovarius sp.]|nr:geranylgeranyl reductase family protein [Aliiroseovarius sp.]
MQDVETEFDVVVIGAGPAGAAAAVTARKAGLSVALVDKARFPRDKLCGGLVSGRSLKALERIFASQKPAQDIYLIGHEAAWHWAGEELVRFPAPYPLWFTKRCDFDHALCQAALANGAVDYTGQRWSDLDQTRNRLTLDSGEALSYRALIAADGAASPVAAQIFGRAFDPKTIGFTLEADYARTAETTDLMVVDFRAVPWGYGWLFPKNGTVTVGVGGLKSENPDLRPALDSLIPKGVEIGKVKGAFLPLGDFRRKPGQGNILFVGDAAGLVDPLTGEGIAYALESGDIAARVAAQAITKGEPAKAGKEYCKRLKPFHRDLQRALKLRQLAYLKAFEAKFRDRLQNSPRIRQAFFELLDGSLNYRGLEKQISRATLAKLGRKMKIWPGRR